MQSWSAPSYRDQVSLRRPCARSLESSGRAVLAKVKFCGMTRAQDTALAAEIGASYIGVVFADGPRRVSPSQARGILDGAGETRGVKRVGVFGTNDPWEIARISEEARP